MRRMVFIPALAALFLLPSCADVTRPAPANELPMYGGRPRSGEQVRKDDAYLEEQLQKAGGDKGQALKSILKEASQYRQRDYYALAMIRFNQAWLLAPDSAEVMLGFAMVTAFEGRIDESISLFDSTRGLTPDLAMTVCLLGRAYQNEGVWLLKHGPRADAEKAQGYIDRARRMYETAAGLAQRDEDLDKIYYQWAVALAMARDYTGAWDKVRLSRLHGGKDIEDGFIQQLSKDYPPPSGDKEGAK